jgi:guanine nucleotide-binding protein G(i) subunit alpha
LSNFTKAFDFDRELFISKVYEKVIRSSLTPNESFISNVYERSMRSSPKPNSTSNSISVLDAQRRQEPSKEATEQERKKSELIDRQIQEDSRRLRREVKVLLLGDRDYGKILVEQLKIIHKERFTTEELIQYQAMVRNSVWGIVQAIVSLVEQTDIKMDEMIRIHAQTLSQEMTNKPDGDSNMSVVGAEAVQKLWESEQFIKLLDSTDVHIPDSAA